MTVKTIGDSLVWYAAADGAVTRPDPRWREFTGQEAQALAGGHWFDAVHAEDRAEAKRLWGDAVASGRPVAFSCRLAARDGAWRQVLLQAAPLADAAVPGQWMVFASAMEPLLQPDHATGGETRLEILDQIGQATRHVQEADSIMAITARLLGEAMGATRCAYADVDSDSDRFTIRSDWAREGVASSAGVYSLDLFGPQATSNLRQGRHLVVHDVDAELGDEGGGRMFNAIGIQAIICAGLVKDGRLVAMMAVHQAAPRRWTKDELLLVSEVVDRCWAHIERARDAAMLKEQDVRKDEFIATLAHELRNPLAPIKYAVAIAARHPLPEVIAGKFAVIDRQVSLMARLIDDLLDVSRINRGLIELRREDAQLDELVVRAVEGTQALLDSQRHRLTVAVPAGIPVHVDPARLVQVIGNLLTNAAKYTPPGGHIEVTGRIEDGRAILAVRDDGLGMASADHGRVFAMFTQLPHTRRHAQGGLGLGLALVRKLVELHGGTVEVDSPGLGEGSTFTVELPVREPSAVRTDLPAPEPVAPVPADAEGGRRILVVEDNDDGRQTLIELLRGMGHRVEDARDGHEALAMAARLDPELVLLDLGLPGIDGYEVAGKLRERFAGAELGIVALTGWGAAHDRMRTRAAGFDEHLVKPVEPAVLARTVHEVLAQVRRRRAG